MNKRLVILGIIILCLVCVERIYYYMFVRGFKNFKLCQEWDKNLTKSQIVDKLGEPVHQEENKDIDTLYFQVPRVSKGLIRVNIDKKTENVTGLKCFEDSE